MKSFDENIDDTLLAIEEAIDATGEDIDYDTISGILTLIFPDDSKIIINRQSATEQLWIAAKSGGFHLDWSGSSWKILQEDIDLETLLSDLCSEQLKEKVTLDIEID